MKNGRSKEFKDHTLNNVPANTDRPIITVDYEKYALFLEDADLTEDQEREFIQTLWNIIVEFVSMGFGVHPVQQAQDACGQIGKTPGNLPISGPDKLLLETIILRENFSKAANGVAEGVA